MGVLVSSQRREHQTGAIPSHGRERRPVHFDACGCGLKPTGPFHRNPTWALLWLEGRVDLLEKQADEKCARNWDRRARNA